MLQPSASNSNTINARNPYLFRIASSRLTAHQPVEHRRRQLFLKQRNRDSRLACRRSKIGHE
jgi:hypothetical protein